MKFGWWKTILIIILNFILFIFYKFIQPACGYFPNMQNPPPCISTMQYIIIIFGATISIYLIITIIYFLFTKLIFIDKYGSCQKLI